MEQQGVQFLSGRNIVKSGNGIFCLFGFVLTLFTLLGYYQYPTVTQTTIVLSLIRSGLPYAAFFSARLTRNGRMCLDPLIK